MFFKVLFSKILRIDVFLFGCFFEFPKIGVFFGLFFWVFFSALFYLSFWDSIKTLVFFWYYGLYFLVLVCGVFSWYLQKFVFFCAFLGVSLLGYFFSEVFFYCVFLGFFQTHKKYLPNYHWMWRGGSKSDGLFFNVEFFCRLFFKGIRLASFS